MTGATPGTGIAPAEFAERRSRLRGHVHAQGLTGYVLFDPSYVSYFTGFRFLSTERPVIYAESAGGESAIFVPAFEVERTEAETTFARVESYPEYPGVEHPMAILARVVDDLGIRGAVGADNDGYPGILGYKGPPLSAVTDARVSPLADEIERMMMLKSPSEVELIRESAHWCRQAHRLLEEYTRPGLTEAEVSLRVQQEATLALLDQRGEVGWTGSGDGIKAGWRGQIGLRSSWAHAVAHDITFRAGDVVVTETGAPIWGYTAELERTLVIGPPSDEVRRLFDHMVAAQDVAFAAFRPGATCAGVDRAVMRYFEESGLVGYWRQHTGHGIGLRNHEAPFLDLGDHTPLEPGMVFTVEPGVYDPTVGGFRHSDTVLVTEDGVELLTDHPRDLESMTLSV